jgi:hypothetical protein
VVIAIPPRIGPGLWHYQDRRPVEACQ